MKRKNTLHDLIVLEELFLDQTRSKFHSVFSILKLRAKNAHDITDHLDALEMITLENLEHLRRIEMENEPR